MNTSYYHIYLSGNNYQDIFYSDQDFIQIINRMALAAHETETGILAYIFHQNHFHLLVETPNVSAFMHYFRMSLSYWFKRAYQIQGTIGMRKYGKYLIQSEEELLDVLKYILRNEVRHGIAATPFTAKWSSLSYYFIKSGEVRETAELVTDPRFISRYIPGCKSLPASWRMTSSGLISPSSYLQVDTIEQMFDSYIHFRNEIQSLSGREVRILEEKQTASRMQNIRRGYHEDHIRHRVSDAELIGFAVEYISIEYPDKNIAMLTSDEKYALASCIRVIYRKTPFKQLGRILGIPLSTLHRKIR